MASSSDHRKAQRREPVASPRGVHRERGNGSHDGRAQHAGLVADQQHEPVKGGNSQKQGHQSRRAEEATRGKDRAEHHGAVCPADGTQVRQPRGLHGVGEFLGPLWPPRSPYTIVGSSARPGSGSAIAPAVGTFGACVRQRFGGLSSVPKKSVNGATAVSRKRLRCPAGALVLCGPAPPHGCRAWAPCRPGPAILRSPEWLEHRQGATCHRCASTRRVPQPGSGCAQGHLGKTCRPRRLLLGAPASSTRSRTTAESSAAWRSGSGTVVAPLSARFASTRPAVPAHISAGAANTGEVSPPNRACLVRSSNSTPSPDKPRTRSATHPCCGTVRRTPTSAAAQAPIRHHSPRRSNLSGSSSAAIALGLRAGVRGHLPPQPAWQRTASGSARGAPAHWKSTFSG